MKKIWFRVGMEATITNGLYNAMVHAKKQNDYKRLEEIFARIIKMGELSGETYIVGKNNGGVDEYDNPKEEISVLF